jgi:hypothetical protein
LVVALVVLGTTAAVTPAIIAATSGSPPPAAGIGSGRVAGPQSSFRTAPLMASARPRKKLAQRRVEPASAPAAATAASGPAALAGCPVPPHPPLPASPPPWHPAVLTTSLPPVKAPAPWTSHVAALTGKGMWIWEWTSTDGGDAGEIVQQAVSAGLHQLWVRVGDSMNGFYGANELDALVPLAHANGIAVIAWGFPYLWDPVGDAQWTAQILDWRAADGQQVDGFSADIEKPTEGVMLDAQRVAVYLELVRQAAGNRLVVATVYPPTDANWDGGYPYRAIAPYIDAFAPMVYWECTDPGADAALDVARLSTLRPVHVIGQAFNFASVGGRAVSPSGAEIAEFLSAGRRAGALGASFWVWQEATPEEWTTIAGFPWRASKPARVPVDPSSKRRR